MTCATFVGQVQEVYGATKGKAAVGLVAVGASGNLEHGGCS